MKTPLSVFLRLFPQPRISWEARGEIRAGAHSSVHSKAASPPAALRCPGVFYRTSVKGSSHTGNTVVFQRVPGIPHLDAAFVPTKEAKQTIFVILQYLQ